MAGNTESFNGWIELLHFKYDSKKLHSAKPTIHNNESLENFKESHYEMVGSTLPLCEYFSAIQIYRQYAVEIDREFNIPRPFDNYDAMNLCMQDPKYGNKIRTFIFYPKGQHYKVGYREQRLQYHPDFPHVLLVRKKPFASFVHKAKK